MCSRVEDDWQKCVVWLTRCGMVGRDHRILSSTAQLPDFVALLKDGVLLCNLINRLSPNAIPSKAFSQRPQASQFVSTLNLKVFLSKCQSEFNMKGSDLFQPADLTNGFDFSKVIHTLSVLSLTSKALESGIRGFETSGRPRVYGVVHSVTVGSDEEGTLDDDPTYQNDSFDDEKENIYEDLCEMKWRTSNAGQGQKISNREHCINELVSTERNYVDHALLMLHTHFIVPLKKEFPEDSFDAIFKYIDELISIHKDFAKHLSLAVSGCDSMSEARSPYSIPDCFIIFKERFLIYGDFCAHLTTAQETLDKLMLNIQHQNHVQKCQMSANEGRFKLRDLLSVPMQRVLKYHLLLQELVKHTPQTHHERKSLERALEEMKDLSLFINEVKRDKEALTSIDLLQESICDLEMPPDTYLRHYGRLLIDGELKVKHDGKQSLRMVFIFDQVLLMCKHTKDKYYYRESLILKCYNLDESNCANFSLIHQDNNQMFTFICKRESRGKWLDAIKLAQDNVMPKFANNEAHSFCMNTFDRTTICDVCRKLLRGVFYQGYLCRKTSMAVHKECLEKAQSMSGPPSLPPKQNPGQLSPKAFKGQAQAIEKYPGDQSQCFNLQPLSFEIGDIIQIINDDDELWEGELNGKAGFFPKVYVRKLHSEDLRMQPRSVSHEGHTNRLSSARAHSTEVTPSLVTDLQRSQPSLVPDLQRSQSHRNTVSESTSPQVVKPRVSLPMKLEICNDEQDWSVLKNYEWFGGTLSRDDATLILQRLPNGTFVVRISVNDNRLGAYSLSIKYDDSVKHIKIQSDPSCTCYGLSSNKVFPTISDLVEYYRQNSLRSIFPEVDTVLLIPFKEAQLALSARSGKDEDGIEFCYAQHNFSARSPTELSLKVGDKVEIINKPVDGKGWWKGRINGKVGYFPSSYV